MIFALVFAFISAIYHNHKDKISNRAKSLLFAPIVKYYANRISH